VISSPMGSVIKRPWEGGQPLPEQYHSSGRLFLKPGVSRKYGSPPLQVSPTFFALDSKATGCLSRSRKADYEKLSINAAAGGGVIVAADNVLMHYFPLQQSTLDAAEVTSLAAIPNGESKTDGIAVGVVVAEQWLPIRAGDGLEGPVVLPPTTVRASGNRYPTQFSVKWPGSVNYQLPTSNVKSEQL
jgi:hypothetical protein